ncbi:MAG: hypothetical protein Unbinned2514contig1001_14 [Prokaryotic dsDNA virus sp.]|nr:MAG: hypothetical protein Unbinned2514contig1001_14 [Prokaryotic dsDNA virus sp.]
MSDYYKGIVTGILFALLLYVLTHNRLNATNDYHVRGEVEWKPLYVKIVND